MTCVVAHTKMAARQAALRRSRQENLHTMATSLKPSPTGMAMTKTGTSTISILH